MPSLFDFPLESTNYVVFSKRAGLHRCSEDSRDWWTVCWEEVMFRLSDLGTEAYTLVFTAP